MKLDFNRHNLDYKLSNMFVCMQYSRYADNKPKIWNIGGRYCYAEFQE